MNTTVKVLAASLILAGCASYPTTPSAPVASAQAGPPPDRNAVIVAYLNRVLKDPESARVSDIHGPTFINIPGGLLAQGTSGWGICFFVNAKNSFGGYTGGSFFTLILRDTSIVRVYGDERDNVFDRQRAIDYCREIQSGEGAIKADGMVPSAPVQVNGRVVTPEEIRAALEDGRRKAAARP
jgi:hypothetical protein